MKNHPPYGSSTGDVQKGAEPCAQVHKARRTNRPGEAPHCAQGFGGSSQPATSRIPGIVGIRGAPQGEGVWPGPWPGA